MLNLVKVVFNALNFVSLKLYKQRINADIDLRYTSIIMKNYYRNEFNLALN